MTDTVNALLVSYLKTLRSRGEVRIPIDESARESLVRWMKAARAGQTAPPLFKKVSPSVSATPESEVPVPTHLKTIPAEPVPLAPATEEEERPPLYSTNAPEPTPDQPAPLAEEAHLTIPQGSVEQVLAYLRQKAENWQPARDLGTLRDTMVFATGNPHAELMLIGEAPGYQEERQQEPFVGPAGAKLTQILKAMGLERSDVYISNIVKFRPSIPNQTTNNRQPTEEEIASCLPFILTEIRTIKPKAIVALGGTAAQGLLGRKGSISSLRGRFHEVEGIPVRVTYHPSYLLRTESNRDKRLVWEDMLTVMEQLGMPVSEKQRGYFLSK